MELFLRVGQVGTMVVDMLRPNRSLNDTSCLGVSAPAETFVNVSLSPAVGDIPVFCTVLDFVGLRSPDGLLLCAYR